MDALINQYISQINAVYRKNLQACFIWRQLTIPCPIPTKNAHIFPQTLLRWRNLMTIHTNKAMANVKAATIHHRLKLSLADNGFNIFSEKKPPNLCQSNTNRTSNNRNNTTTSQDLSSTTVPSTLSYEASFLPEPAIRVEPVSATESKSEAVVSGAESLVTKPQRTNSPILGNTKLAK